MAISEHWTLMEHYTAFYIIAKHGLWWNTPIECPDMYWTEDTEARVQRSQPKTNLMHNISQVLLCGHRVQHLRYIDYRHQEQCKGITNMVLEVVM